MLKRIAAPTAGSIIPKNSSSSGWFVNGFSMGYTHSRICIPNDMAREVYVVRNPNPFPNTAKPINRSRMLIIVTMVAGERK